MPLGSAAKRRNPSRNPRWAGLRAPKTPKTSELIASWMREHMRQNRPAPGDPLPTEIELIEHFGAARPTVREAMRILEAQQLVRIRRGAAGGARYNLPGVDMVAEHTGIYLEAHGANQSDLTAARLTIEPRIVRFIAEHSDSDDVERLAEAANEQATMLDDGAAFARAHDHFYEILAELCPNITLSLFLLILRELMQAQMELMGDMLQYGGDQARKSRRAHIRAKLRLVELLRAGDGEGAERWWSRHLKALMTELGESGRGDIVVVAPGTMS